MEMQSLSQLRAKARASLRHIEDVACALTLVYYILYALCTYLIVRFLWVMHQPFQFTWMDVVLILACILCLLSQNLLRYGLAITFLEIRRGTKPSNCLLFCGFNSFIRVSGTFLLRAIYSFGCFGFVFYWGIILGFMQGSIILTCATWLLLLPGLFLMYRFSMLSYILHDRPDLAFHKAIMQSSKMMDNHELELFKLDISFIGWFVLVIITLGLGLIAVMPYYQSARAAFYEQLKQGVSPTDSAQ